MPSVKVPLASELRIDCRDKGESNEPTQQLLQESRGGCWWSDPGCVVKVDQGYAHQPTGSACLPLQRRLSSQG